MTTLAQVNARRALAPLPGHHLTVTHGPAFGRAITECTCGTPPQRVHASTRSAERAALRHYITHAPDDSEDTWRARALLVSTDIRKNA